MDKHVFQVQGHSRRGIYELDSAPGAFFQTVHQERVMGASEHYGVGTGFEQRGKALADYRLCLASAQHSPFDQFDKAKPGVFEYLYLVFI